MRMKIDERFEVELAPETLDVDAPRDLDIDMAIIDEGLLLAAESLGAPLRSGGTRTGRLTAQQPDALGLGDLQRELTQIARHEVTFMLFRDERSARRRGLRMFAPR